MIEYYVSAAPSVIATLDEAGRSSRYSEMVYWLTRYQRSQEVQQLLAETSAQIPQMIMLDSLHVALLERYDL